VLFVLLYTRGQSITHSLKTKLMMDSIPKA